MERLIEINWTKKDAVRFDRIYRVEINGHSNLLLLYMLLLISYPIFSKLTKNSALHFIFLILQISAIIFVLIYEAYITRKADRLITSPQNDHLFGKKSYFFSSDYISEGSTEKADRIPWENIRKVIETKRYLALELPNNSLIIFPKDQLNKWNLNFLLERIRVKNVYVRFLNK